MHSLRQQKQSRSHASRRTHREPYLASQSSQVNATAKAPAGAGHKEEHFKHYAESHAWKRPDEPPLPLGAARSGTRRYARALFVACMVVIGIVCAAIVLTALLNGGRNGVPVSGIPMAPSSGGALPRGISASELPYEGRRRPSVDANVVTQSRPVQSTASGSASAKTVERDAPSGSSTASKAEAPRPPAGKEARVSKPRAKGKPAAVKEKEASKPPKRPARARKRQEFERLQQQAADEMLRNLQMAGQ
jgi:hypothetical protein